jgi:hypothetical protein
MGISEQGVPTACCSSKLRACPASNFCCCRMQLVSLGAPVFCESRWYGSMVSIGMKAVYVPVNNGDAHDGIDRELMLSLMGKDEPAGELAEHEGQA